MAVEVSSSWRAGQFQHVTSSSRLFARNELTSLFSAPEASLHDGQLLDHELSSLTCGSVLEIDFGLGLAVAWLSGHLDEALNRRV